MNREVFKEECQKLGIQVNDDILTKLDIYAQFLIEYNQTTNLTAITDLESIYLKHFFDSLAICRAIDLFHVHTLVDIGTGAGFPGMVLKIVFPHLDTILIDSNNKKTKFLELLCAKLSLDHIQILNCRSEDFARQNIDKFDLVTARAVTNLQVLAEITLPMVKVGGYFVPLKGNIDDELNHAMPIIAKLQGRIALKEEYLLPFENSHRTLLKIQKTAANPHGYPRPFAIIKKALKNHQK